MKSTVGIVYAEDAAISVWDALESLGGLAPLLRNRHVAIKPNDTWASPADLTACTQADTVEAVIRYVKRFGPRRITVTGGSGAEETDRVFHYLGIDRVIRQEGVEFFDHNRPPFRSLKLKHGPQKDVMVNPYVLAYDTIISLAQHKVHNSSAVSLTMLNTAMSFPAADYYGHPRTARLHPHNFFKDLHGFIAAMYERLPAHLGIIAGHPVMVREGPIGGDVFESGLTIASTDCVAADSVGALLLGQDSVRHIQLASEYGLGNASLHGIELAGLNIEEARIIMHTRAEAAGLSFAELIRQA
jgi:uncharacterized protein (DUF362 family)